MPSYDILMPIKDQVHSSCFRMPEMLVEIQEVKNLSLGATLKINPSDGNTVRFPRVVCNHNRC